MQHQNYNNPAIRGNNNNNNSSRAPAQYSPNSQRPLQLPRQQQQHHHQNIPTLQVTIPPPAHHNNGPRSPYGQNHQQPSRLNSPPSPSSSAETLVNSPNAQYSSKGEFGTPKMTMPFASYPSSPSITSFKQAALDQTRVADPDNDRLMPATPNGSTATFWKRFSTVVHENERKDAMAKKTGNGAGKPKAGSEWLSKETGGQKRYRYWVGALAFLIIAAIVGSLVYHYVFKKEDPSSSEDKEASLPTTHDFGLGDGTNGKHNDEDDDDTSITSSAHRSSSTQLTSMPSASAVQAGETLRARSLNAHKVVLGGGGNGSHGLERRRLEDLD